MPISVTDVTLDSWIWSWYSSLLGWARSGWNEKITPLPVFSLNLLTTIPVILDFHARFPPVNGTIIPVLGCRKQAKNPIWSCTQRIGIKLWHNNSCGFLIGQHEFASHCTSHCFADSLVSWLRLAQKHFTHLYPDPYLQNLLFKSSSIGR